MLPSALRRIAIVGLIALTLLVGGLTGAVDTALARPKIDAGHADCVIVSGAEANLILGRTDLDVHAQYIVCRWPDGSWSVDFIRRNVYR
jgi:porphobilinogen deaminase